MRRIPEHVVAAMNRTITGFHADELGDWVAELSCLHGQHVRHAPPFRVAAWVTTSAGREARVGSSLDCPLCDRAEMPDGLSVVRTAGPFDESNLPPGLRRDHVVAEGTWALLRVISGTVVLTMDETATSETRDATHPDGDRCIERRIDLHPGDHHAIPPSVTHRVSLVDAVIEIDFLTRR